MVKFTKIKVCAFLRKNKTKKCEAFRNLFTIEMSIRLSY